MPTTQALQVFYGTLPLILMLLAMWMRSDMLLRDILKRLGHVENVLNEIKDQIANVRERLVVLETRAGIVYHA